jgi:hypothetical protein
MGLVKIDTIDPAYYPVADGDGQTTAACEAGVEVGSRSHDTILEHTRHIAPLFIHTAGF